ncbi:hypothetical protein HGRIS_007236 [Hohenbuehelia grisea]|uniref:Transmembrane protein n=1 Tax=Hohenbuehelia grisea TaxID=104357 RepID=A0ABR3JBK9_9AGAR
MFTDTSRSASHVSPPNVRFLLRREPQGPRGRPSFPGGSGPPVGWNWGQFGGGSQGTSTLTVTVTTASRPGSRIPSSPPTSSFSSERRSAPSASVPSSTSSSISLAGGAVAPFNSSTPVTSSTPLGSSSITPTGLGSTPIQTLSTHSNAPMIAGIAVGITAALLTAFIIIFILCRRRSRHRRNTPHEQPEVAAQPFAQVSVTSSPNTSSSRTSVNEKRPRMYMPPLSEATEAQSTRYETPTASVLSPMSEHGVVTPTRSDEASQMQTAILLARVAELEALVASERDFDLPPPSYASESRRDSRL